MTVDPDDGLVTNLMLGAMVAFGADVVLFVGVGWAAGFFPAAAFGGVTALVVSVFALWIGWRWRKIRALDSAERDAVEELKHQYASGNISEAEFERKLDALVDSPGEDGGERSDAERPRERSR